MSYIEEMFHFYETEQSFKLHLKQGVINPDSICFIKETSQIYTQGTFIGIHKQNFEVLEDKVKELEDSIKYGFDAQLPNLKTINGESVVGEGDITIDFSLYKIVDSLPEIGQEDNKIYLVLTSSGGGQNNVYTEYIYTNDTWEKLGEFKADIDLTPYIKFTDLATADKAGAMSAEDKKLLTSISSNLPVVAITNKVTTSKTNLVLEVSKIAESGSVEKSDLTLAGASTTAAGMMAADDKKKLDDIAENATADEAIPTTELEEIFV